MRPFLLKIQRQTESVQLFLFTYPHEAVGRAATLGLDRFSQNLHSVHFSDCFSPDLYWLCHLSVIALEERGR